MIVRADYVVVWRGYTCVQTQIVLICTVRQARAHSKPLRAHLSRVEASIDTEFTVSKRLLVLHTLIDFLLSVDAELGIIRGLIARILTILLTLSRS